ncbi:MAG TPA: response regulator [Bacteroidales bacterium]|nr:response regulator [Bacteroidales bacterium]
MSGRYKILIAEDEEYNYTLVKLIFEKEGVDVIRAHDGKEAIELLKNDKDIDLVLMDIKMPVMNGLDAAREIKKINSKMPIIAVTAYALREDRPMCLRAGCDEIITKPINRQKLIDIAFHLMKSC